ncbi:MAG TPA: hypothetical protein VGZ01_11465 [Trinickia sp.]|nr:hypothetical protein [Trinickia sp.]
MLDSSTVFLLMLALFVGAALALATRYHTDHPLDDLVRWMGEHHWLDWMRHRH